MNKKGFAVIAAVLVCAILIISASLSASGGKTSSSSSYAMGSPVSVTVYGEKDSGELCRSSLIEINELDEKYLSHTNSCSAVSILNDKKTVTADEFFTDYLRYCLSLSAHSEKFTLCSGALKNLWQIESGGYVPSRDEITNVLPACSEENIEIDENAVTLGKGAILDFGALGKGTACGTAINTLKEKGIKNALCTVGGTVGMIGAPDGKDKFTVGVRDPFGTPNDYFGTLTLTDCFISTSGDYEKYFESNSTRYCHIFDATTGYPVQSDITSVTAVAYDGTVSDFLSTVIFIEGIEKGLELADEFNAEVIIVKKDKTVYISNGLKYCFELLDDSFSVTVL